MRVAIVSTSVNPRPAAYAEWAKQGDLIVAGDVNSPDELEWYVRDLGGRYLTPRNQSGWSFSETLGWSCIQRRNAAVMTAYVERYDYVVTVDDDNSPTDDWVARHIEHTLGVLPQPTRNVRGDNGWTDIGQFNDPRTRQRGTPFGVVRSHITRGGTTPHVVASTAQVIGDPDCDAVTRLTHNPRVEGVTHNVVVDVHDFAAFNSQATLWKGSWAPLIAVLPEVGRYDDIIASFIAKRIMRENHVSFYAGAPCVTQDRNLHDPISDLRNELWGMQNTPFITSCLNSMNLDPLDKLSALYADCIDALRDVMPPRTIRFMELWCNTWKMNEWT